jgi:hypothetical protein
MDTVPDGRRRRRWWIPLGLIALFCVVASVFWLTRGPVTGQKPVVANQMVEPVTAGKTFPATPNGQQTPSTIPRTQAAVPPAAQSTLQPQKKTSTRPSVAPTPDAVLTAPPPEPRQQETVETKPPPAMPAPAAEKSQPTEIAEPPRPSEKKKADNTKEFRKDDRVELQALVWAPEAAERFVVINNRLLKEGGSIDNITVVKINPDDVLLSEGADRWHQAFNIR